MFEGPGLIKDEILSANLFSHGLGVSKILQVQCSQSLQCGNNKQLLNDLNLLMFHVFFGEVKKLINQLPPISSSGAEVGNCPFHGQSEQIHKAPNRQSIHHEVSGGVMGHVSPFEGRQQVLSSGWFRSMKWWNIWNDGMIVGSWCPQLNYQMMKWTGSLNDSWMIAFRLDLPLANTALTAAATGSAWNVAIALLDEMPTMELRLGTPNITRDVDIHWSDIDTLIHVCICNSSFRNGPGPTFRIQAFTVKKVDEMFSVHFGEWFAKQKSSRLKQQSFGWWFYFFLFSPLFREDSHFDKHIFQRGWFNHQLVIHWVLTTHLSRITSSLARPDVISFSTTMDGFPWKKSLLLLDEMKVRDPTTHCPMLDQWLVSILGSSMT